MSPRNLAVAASALIAVFLIHLWPVSKSTSVVAFAEVQGQVETTKSVQFTETRHFILNNKSGPTIQSRVMILGRYLRRDDKKVLTAGDGGPRVGDEPLGHHISIFDAQAEKVFFLFPDTRQFRPPQPIHVSPRDDSIKTETSKPARQVDFYERLRGLPSDKAEKLPDRTIDGQRAIGYRFVWKNEQKDGAEHFTGTTIRDIWADPRTKLPVRIEHKMRSTNPKEAGGDWVFSDFIWDAPLDRSLFSMTPPEGYKEKK